MNYTEFKSLKEKPQNVVTDELPEYPLEFGDDMAYRLDDFDSFDDFMDEHEIESFEEDLFKLFPDYESLGACDVPFLLEKKPDFHFDSYGEFLLCVNTTDENFPVVILDPSSTFETLFDSFEEFYDSLSSFE